MEILQRKKINDLDLYKKRVELLVGSRFRDTGSASHAVSVQDKLRKKIGHWQGAKEVKKWRNRGL